MKTRKAIVLDEPEKEPLSKAQQIEILESKLKDADGKAAAAISRQIGLLNGTLPLPNAGRKPAQPQPTLSEREARREEQERRAAAGELPLWWNERQCRLHLFWALCDTVSEAAPDFDGIVNANPQPKNAISAAINQLWVSLPDSVKTKLVQLAVEHQQRKRLSGTDEVQMLERALRDFPLTTARSADVFL